MDKETKSERVKNLLERLVCLRRKCATTKSAKLQKELEEVQQLCIQELEYLIIARTRKYKKFANYDDLQQDGRLALHLAMRSYEPEKGDFYWWADKYIKTKISREANRHSTIKIPLKHTKFVTPYKVSQLPVIVDNEPIALESLSQHESFSIIREAIEKLPDDQKKVIKLHFEINPGTYGANPEFHSIGKICDALKIKRVHCVKLLNEAKKSLRQELAEL